MGDRPSVFVSYSHDSEEHKQRVLELANRLEKDGIHCILDRWETAPPQGWPAWMDQHLDEADFVLVVCSARYAEKAKVRPKTSSGVRFESVLIVQDLYAAGMWNEKFIPVLLKGATSEDIIRPLRPYSYYRIEDDGYDELYRRLTNQPEHVPPPRGTIRKLPSRPPAAAKKAAPRVSDRNEIFMAPRRNPYFSGRKAVLQTLREQLTSGHSAALSQAISGLGGVGKTQTARPARS